MSWTSPGSKPAGWKRWRGSGISLLLDLAIPLYGRKVPLTPYLYFQYFVGYGESLLFYKERETFFRVGFALFP